VREFRATYERRLPLQELLNILVNISVKRPNFNEVTEEVTDILRRKDPMYALLVFATRYSKGTLTSRSNASSEMTSSLGSKFSLGSSSDNCSSAPSTRS